MGLESAADDLADVFCAAGGYKGKGRLDRRAQLQHKHPSILQKQCRTDGPGTQLIRTKPLYVFHSQSQEQRAMLGESNPFKS